MFPSGGALRISSMNIMLALDEVEREAGPLPPMVAHAEVLLRPLMAELLLNTTKYITHNGGTKK